MAQRQNERSGARREMRGQTRPRVQIRLENQCEGLSSPNDFCGSRIREEDSDAAVLPTRFEWLCSRGMNQLNKKRWIVIGIVALAAASAAFCVFGLSKPEPLYQGRPVGFWIEQMGVPPPSEEAWKAFSRTNQDALPFLIATLKFRQPLRD